MSAGGGMRRVWVVMPMFNEVRHVCHTLRGLPGWVSGVVLVDDGSNDGSAAEVKKLSDPRVRIVTHHERRGVGAALSSGLGAVCETDAQVVVTMDADGQMSAEDLPAVVEPIANGSADYVKGSRFDAPDGGSGMPLMRRIANRALSRHLSGVLGDPRLSDAHCGYTAMVPRIAQKLAATTLHPTYGVYNDILYHVLANASNRVRYVPVRTVYGDEKSHLGWADVVRLLRLTLSLQRRGAGGAAAKPGSLPLPAVDSRSSPRRSRGWMSS